MRHLARNLKLTQRGDTIIEVLIALAVLSSAISVAYVTANRSLLNARQSQEMSRATVLAQSQAELLRARATITDAMAHPNDFIYITGSDFCIKKDKVVKISVTPVDPDPDNDNACFFGTTDVPYKVAITYNQTNDDAFTIKVTWANVLGDGDDTVTLVYRVHKEI